MKFSDDCIEKELKKALDFIDRSIDILDGEYENHSESFSDSEGSEGNFEQ